MKELTYEDWQKNPAPRMMWVWSYKEDNKVQRKVIYMLKSGVYENPVLTVADECTYETYKHCAEIKKQRRMTNKELSRWLKEKPTREYKCKNGDYVYDQHAYIENYANDKVDDNILIRESDSECREPLVEVEE